VIIRLGDRLGTRRTIPSETKCFYNIGAEGEMFDCKIGKVRGWKACVNDAAGFEHRISTSSGSYF
jgi:hypothetical protein